MKTTHPTTSQNIRHTGVAGRYTGKLSMLMLSSLLLFAAGCTKNDVARGTASLVMFNALIGQDTLVTNFKGTQPLIWYKDANMLIYGMSAPGNLDNFGNPYNAYVGNQRLALFGYPDTTAHDRPVYDLTLDLQQGTINSLFLVGKEDAPDNLFVRDHPPYHPDSTMGFRFVNLSPGSAPVSVNIQGLPNGSEAGNLSFKGVTGFTNYPVKKETSNYVFEFRDETTGDLLGSFAVDIQDQQIGLNTINRMRYRNFTLILYGLRGETSGKYKQAVFLTQH